MNKPKYFLIYNEDGTYVGVCERIEDTFASLFRMSESRHYVGISKRTYNKIRKIEELK